jgi:hypothetical protein
MPYWPCLQVVGHVLWNNFTVVARPVVWMVV